MLLGNILNNISYSCEVIQSITQQPVGSKIKSDKHEWLALLLANCDLLEFPDNHDWFSAGNSELTPSRVEVWWWWLSSSSSRPSVLCHVSVILLQHLLFALTLLVIVPVHLSSNPYLIRALTEEDYAHRIITSWCSLLSRLTSIPRKQGLFRSLEVTPWHALVAMGRSTA